MKITVELEFFDYFPPAQLKAFMDCLDEVRDGTHKYGKIELNIAPGKDGKSVIKDVFQGKFKRE